MDFRYDILLKQIPEILPFIKETVIIAIFGYDTFIDIINYNINYKRIQNNRTITDMWCICIFF